MTERVTGEDLLVDDDEVVAVEDGFGGVECLYTPLDNLDMELDADECVHVFRVGGRRLLGLEPHPSNGYWTTCPRCGMYVGQERFADVDIDVTATSATSLRV